jgi:Ca2+-binding EF-hand superfamily protein
MEENQQLKLIVGGGISKKRQESLNLVKRSFDRQGLEHTWSHCDKNASKNASLAEVDGMLDYFARTQAHKYDGFFAGLNNKPAIIRAFHYTRKGGDGDDWIQKREFPALLKNLHFFNNMYSTFSGIDTSGDMRIDAGEFASGLHSMGVQCTGIQAREIFNEIDRNGGGFILFAEFCKYCLDAMDISEGKPSARQRKEGILQLLKEKFDQLDGYGMHKGVTSRQEALNQCKRIGVKISDYNLRQLFSQCKADDQGDLYYTDLLSLLREYQRPGPPTISRKAAQFARGGNGKWVGGRVYAPSADMGPPAERSKRNDDYVEPPKPLAPLAIDALETMGRALSENRKESKKIVRRTFGNRVLLQEAWSWCDKNHSGNTSLAEIDSMIEQFTKYFPPTKFGGFFVGLDNKPAMIRAFQYTRRSEATSDGDDWIQKQEFPALLKNLHFFNQLWDIFDELDVEDDRRVDIGEFENGLAKLGVEVDGNEHLADEIFNEIDRNGGGQILFDEFCKYCMHAIEVAEGRMTVGDYEATRARGILHAKEMERRMGGGNRRAGGLAQHREFRTWTQGRVYPPKQAAPAPTSRQRAQTDAEAKNAKAVKHGMKKMHRRSEEEKRLMAYAGQGILKMYRKSLETVKRLFGDKRNLQESWQTCDKNGNGITSLAEVDGMVFYYMRTSKWDNFFRNLYNKGAIMRAVKYTRTKEPTSDGDDWIQKQEFPALLKNLHFFNQLWQVFDELDIEDDRRVSFEEFRSGLGCLHIVCDDEQAKEIFDDIDGNGGGQILFDEFCKYCIDAMHLAQKQRYDTADLNPATRRQMEEDGKKQRPKSDGVRLSETAEHALKRLHMRLGAGGIGDDLDSAGEGIGKSASRAAAAAVALCREFRMISAQHGEDDAPASVDIEEFDMLLERWGVEEVEVEEADDLFRHLQKVQAKAKGADGGDRSSANRNRDRLVLWDTLLNCVLPPLSEERQQLVDAAWGALDKAVEGAISLDTLMEAFNVRGHPWVKERGMRQGSGQLKSGKLIQETRDCFTAVADDGVVTKSEFFAYHSAVSALLPKDATEGRERRGKYEDHEWERLVGDVWGVKGLVTQMRRMGAGTQQEMQTNQRLTSSASTQKDSSAMSGILASEGDIADAAERDIDREVVLVLRGGGRGAETVEDMPEGSRTRQRFCERLKRDLSDAVGGERALDPSRIEVTSIMAGSVIVGMRVKKGQGGGLTAGAKRAAMSPGDVFNELQQQLLDSTSALYHGGVTGQVDGRRSRAQMAACLERYKEEQKRGAGQASTRQRRRRLGAGAVGGNGGAAIGGARGGAGHVDILSGGDEKVGMVKVKRRGMTRTLQIVIRGLRDDLRKRGAGGVVGLGREFRKADKDRSGSLSKREFRSAVQTSGLYIKDQTFKALFAFFDSDGDGTVSYSEFLSQICVPMNERRKKLVRKAFRLMDKDGDGTVSIADVADVFDASMDPEVQQGLRTEEEAKMDFLKVFDQPGEDGKRDGIITLDEWKDYYGGISADISNDDYFELMIRNAWHISGGEGVCANSSNRRVLVTDSYGKQMVVEVPDDLDIAHSTDPNVITERLKESGIDVGGGVALASKPGSAKSMKPPKNGSSKPPQPSRAAGSSMFSIMQGDDAENKIEQDRAGQASQRQSEAETQQEKRRQKQRQQQQGMQAKQAGRRQEDEEWVDDEEIFRMTPQDTGHVQFIGASVGEHYPQGSHIFGGLYNKESYHKLQFDKGFAGGKGGKSTRR